jgi:hypothetical protein
MFLARLHSNIPNPHHHPIPHTVLHVLETANGVNVPIVSWPSRGLLFFTEWKLFLTTYCERGYRWTSNSCFQMVCFSHSVAVNCMSKKGLTHDGGIYALKEALQLDLSCKEPSWIEFNRLHTQVPSLAPYGTHLNISFATVIRTSSTRLLPCTSLQKPNCQLQLVEFTRWFQIMNQPDLSGSKPIVTPQRRCRNKSNPWHNASRAVPLPLATRAPIPPSWRFSAAKTHFAPWTWRQALCKNKNLIFEYI